MRVRSRERPKDVFDVLTETCRSRLHEDWPVETMAMVSGQSARTFRCRFSTVFGATPVAWIEGLRVGRATTLLLTSQAKQQDIAVLCGFRSDEQMRVAFRRQVGLTPGAVRDRGLRMRNGQARR